MARSQPALHAPSAALADAVRSLGGRRVIVLGDLVADEYVYGMSSRISREAPVVVVRYERNEYRLGGAANAAHNVAALGGLAVVIGVVGRDEAGRRVIDACKRAKIVTSGILPVARPTTVKTRVMAGSINTTKQQVLRLDREDTTPLGEALEAKLLAQLDKQAPSADAILVSDYGMGVMTDRLIARVVQLAKAGKRVVVDSRFNLHAYRGVTAATPNEPEAEAAAGFALADDAKVAAAGAALRKELQLEALVLKRGQQGMAVFERGKKPVMFPIVGSKEVTDVTGAGDTVIATLTLALAAGLAYEPAARLANVAAGVTVAKTGAATASPAELRRACVEAG